MEEGWKDINPNWNSVWSVVKPWMNQHHHWVPFIFLCEAFYSSTLAASKNYIIFSNAQIFKIFFQRKKFERKNEKYFGIFKILFLFFFHKEIFKINLID